MRSRLHWFDAQNDHSMCGGECNDPDCSWGAGRTNAIAVFVFACSVLALVWVWLM